MSPPILVDCMPDLHISPVPWYVFSMRATTQLQEMVEENGGKMCTLQDLENAYLPSTVDPSRCIIGLDCEGVNLSLLGNLTTVLLCARDPENASKNRVDIIDLVSSDEKNPFDYSCSTYDGVKMFLTTLLATNDAVKCVHDCRCDAGALQSALGIQLKGVFDTSVAHRFVNCLMERYPPLSNVLQTNSLAAKCTNQPDYRNQPDYWAQPLDRDRVAYCIADVVNMPQLAEKLTQSIEKMGTLEMDKFIQLSSAQVSRQAQSYYAVVHCDTDVLAQARKNMCPLKDAIYPMSFVRGAITDKKFRYALFAGDQATFKRVVDECGLERVAAPDTTSDACTSFLGHPIK